MIEIILGNIFDIPAEAMAIPSNGTLSSAPGLREQAFKHFTAQKLPQICEQHMRKSGKSSLPECSIVVTPIDHRYFKYIFHCVTPYYIKSKGSTRINQLYDNLFQEIAKNQIQSISLSTIGSGQANWVLDEVLDAFCSGFQKYRDKIPTVKINYVVFDKQYFEFIHDYLLANLGEYSKPQSQILQQPNAVQFQQPQIQQNYYSQQNQQQQNQQQDKPYNSQFLQSTNFKKFQNKEQQPLEERPSPQKSTKSNIKISEVNANQAEDNLENFQSCLQDQKSQFQGRDKPDDGFQEITNQNLQSKQIQSQQSYKQQDKQEKYYLSLIFKPKPEYLGKLIYLDQVINEVLKICKNILQLHQKAQLGNLEHKIDTQDYLMKFHVTKNILEIKQYSAPEMLEQNYIADLQDSYTLGKIIQQLLENIRIGQDEKDQSKKIEIQRILEGLLQEDTNQRLRIDQIMIKLITIMDEQEQSNWNDTIQSICGYYSKLNNLTDIKFKKHDYLQKFPQQEKVLEPLESSISERNNSSDQNTLNSLANQKIFESDSKLQQGPASIQNSSSPSSQIVNLKEVKCDCLVIPVNKYNFEQSLPPYINLTQKHKDVLATLIQLAQQEKEHFLLESKITIPEFQNESIIFVFCPHNSEQLGRQIALKTCFQDIYHYAFKCLKAKTICLNPLEIFYHLIEDKQGFPNEKVQNILLESLKFNENDELILEPVLMQNKNWSLITIKSKPLVNNNLSVSIYQQDITKIKGIDAIVNAANEYLQNGGGVCGAIFRAAGAYKLEQEIKNHQQFQNGYPKINVSEVFTTGSHNISSNNGPQYILHAVGPIYRNEYKQECQKRLKDCIENIFKECERLNIKSIAIPPISAGIYGYPEKDCALVFKKTLLEYNFKYKFHIHIVDILPGILETFNFIFQDNVFKQSIHSQIQNVEQTECLILPFSLDQIDSKFYQQIFEMAGNSLKNDLMLKIQNYQPQGQNDILEQIYLCQGYKMKFKGIYNLMFISKPQVVTEDKREWFNIFDQILYEVFAKRGFKSITICLYTLLLKFLGTEEFNRIKYINIFNDAVNTYSGRKKGNLGKVVISSNVVSFIDECKQIFQ